MNVAKRMGKPLKRNWVGAIRLARYLKCNPRCQTAFAFDSDDGQLIGQADSNWAGEDSAMRSTSGGCLRWGPATLKTWSTTQSTVSITVAEAEVYVPASVPSKP